MRIILPLIILTLAFETPTMAQDMTVRQKNGLSTTVPMEQLHKLTFQDGDMTVTTENGTRTKFSTAGVASLTFGTATSVETVKAIDGKVEYTAQSQTATVRDSKGQTLSIFNLSGKTVLELEISSDAQEISLSGLSKGVYLVRLGSRTVKIVL